METYLKESVILLQNKEITAWWNGQYITIEDVSRDGIALSNDEAIELANAIATHLGGPL